MKKDNWCGSAGKIFKEIEAFHERYNKRDIRECICCGRLFNSPGSHIRKCQKCKYNESQRSQHNAEFEEYFTCKSHAAGAQIMKDTDAELIRELVTAYLPF